MRRQIAGLTCAQWGPGKGPAVLALHGLTNTSEVWRGFAEAAPELRVIAPDLPGRGGSLEVRAGAGLKGHAQAVAALAEHLALEDFVLLGHSMGGYLAPLIAAALPGRVRHMVLLDGGVPPESTWRSKRTVVRALWTVYTRSLRRTYPDKEAFVDAVEARAIANRPDLRPRLEQWADYLLDRAEDGGDGGGKARLDMARVIDDAVDTLGGEPTLPLLAGLDTPVHVILAAHDGDDQAPPFISDHGLALGRQKIPRLTAERTEANHVTMLFDERVVTAVSGSAAAPRSGPAAA
ncbi:alpha/beta fold hydrolase [Actinoplanes sp. NPDC049596]|uniref:alpha/beta fold hydrolase n=1 Tax=unclassified Actinoplanes TaxID=2626549 RepID=UPI00342273ED